MFIQSTIGLVLLRKWKCLGFTLAGICLCAPVFAAITIDKFQPYIGYSILHDSNLLRSPNDGVVLPDTYHRAEAGLLFEGLLSQQKLIANLNFNRTHFNRYDQLDNDGKDLLAQWNWHVGPHLEGNVGRSYIQSLSQFVEFHDLQRNVRTQQRKFFDASWRYHPEWRLRGGASRSTVNYNLSSQQSLNRTEDTEEFGIDYLAPSNSTIGLQLRHIRGEFPYPQDLVYALVDNSYNQDEVKAKIKWMLSGKSQLEFLGGWVKRKHDFFSQRDVSAFNARLVSNWVPSAKVGINVSAWQETGAVEDLTASYTLNQGASFGSTWDMSSKTRLEWQLRKESRDYRGEPTFDWMMPTERKDTYRTASLTWIYVPFQHLKTALMIQREERSSNISYYNYRANSAMFNARYEFGNP